MNPPRIALARAAIAKRREHEHGEYIVETNDDGTRWWFCGRCGGLIQRELNREEAAKTGFRGHVLELYG